MMDPRVLDPAQRVVSRSNLSETEIDETVVLLEALRRWRETEEAVSEASRRYMKLGDNDMRALRFVIAAQEHGSIVTPSAIAEHLGISTASTTKLLDRLTAAGHIRRLPHPTDRRSVAVEVVDETRDAARESIGRVYGRRFDAAAKLTSAEREVVTRFLRDLASTSPSPSTAFQNAPSDRAPEGSDGAD